MAIAGEARARRADLIVMATQVRTGPGRVARESVADQVLRLSPVPVLLLGPDSMSGDLPDTILAPVDGTPTGNAALELAASLAQILKAELVVLRVVSPAAYRELLPFAAAGGPDNGTSPAVPGALADAQHQVDWLATRLRGWGIAAQGRAVLGALPDAILETADRIAAGLIVMSTSAHRAPGWAAPDGVAVATARRARQPTLLVRLGTALARPARPRHATVSTSPTT